MRKSDAYYKLSLRPKYWDGENIEVYIKGDKKKLVSFLGDIGDSYYVVVLDANSDGFVLKTKTKE